MNRLPYQTAEQLVNDWVAACRRRAEGSTHSPYISLSRPDDRYLVMLRQMIADKLEQILNEVNRNA